MTWVFGYGSLIWRPDFSYLEAADGCIEGWMRRFWQASPDHRGTPSRPGRVVTLGADPAGVCFGRAYRVDAGDREAVLVTLDRRECAGYALHSVSVLLSDGREVPGLVYVAGPDNPNFLGSAPLEEMAGQVLGASGLSGANREYVLELDRALSEMGHPDPHVRQLADRVRALQVRAGTGPA